MYYLQRYYYIYRPPEDAHLTNPLNHALLKVAIISLALKVQFQEYVLERLPIEE